MAYLDAAIDRRTAEFERSVEATRAGTIFAHDAESYRKWAAVAYPRPAADGSGLGALAASTAGGVVRGGFEFRRE